MNCGREYDMNYVQDGSVNLVEGEILSCSSCKETEYKNHFGDTGATADFSDKPRIFDEDDIYGGLL